MTTRWGWILFPGRVMSVVIGLVLVAAMAFAAPGDLDPNFGTGGIVTTAIGVASDTGRSIAVQADGRIVVAGQSSNGSNDDFSLVRYNSDGTLDTSFGGGDGIVTTAIGAADDQAFGVALQGDGHIVVVGYSSNGSNSDFALVRYTSNGSLDTSFGGGDGIVTTNIGAGTNDYAVDMALHGDGRIVVAGYSLNGTVGDFALVRYNSNGSLDASFGDNGIITTDIGTVTDDRASSVALQGDGRVVVAGRTFPFDKNHFALVRYNANGTLDTSFGGGDGIVITPVGTTDDAAYDVVLQADGRIVVAGSSSNGGYNDFALVCYTTDGTLDPSFGGGDGIVTTQIGTSVDHGYGVALQGDGRIVVAGYSIGLGNPDFALVRYNQDGTLDPSFGRGDGIVTTAGSSSDIAFDVALQGDGRIVVAGSSSNGNADFALARYDAGAGGELALQGTLLLNPDTLEGVGYPLPNVPVLVSITAENVGFVALPATVVNVSDLSNGTTASGIIPALAAGAQTNVQIPFTFTGSPGCRELSIQAELLGPATQRQVLVPVGAVDACSSTSAIAVTTTLATRTAGQPLAAGTQIVISGTSDYTGYSTPPLGAEVTVELINGTLVYSYTTYTRGPDGSWALGNANPLYLPENSGTYTLKVTVSDGQLRGSSSQSVTVLPGTGPNLRGEQLRLEGSEVYQLGTKKYAPVNAEVQASVILQNIGVSAATGNVKVKFYHDDQPYPTPDALLCEELVSINLAGVDFSNNYPLYSRKTVTCSSQWTSTAAGIENIYVQIDTDNVISESLETDNQLSAYLEIRERKPDLRPYRGGIVPSASNNAYLVFSQEPGVGETVTISADIFNVGTDDLPLSSFNVEFYDGNPATGGALIDTARITATIQQGTKAVATVDWDTAAATVGYHDIWVVVDAADEIDEDFESENRAARTLDVLDTDANLQVLQVASGFAVVNQLNAISAELKNRSMLPVTNNQIGFYLGDPMAGGTLLGTVQSGAISRGNHKTVSISWTPVATGTVYLFARVEPSGHHTYTAASIAATPIPDIRILSNGITISGADSTRSLGSSATVSANISEIQGAAAGLFSVRFTAEGPDSQSLGTSRISLGAGASAIVNAPLALVFNGREYLVKVEIGSPDEGDGNYSNNNATKAANAFGGYPIAKAGVDQNAFTGAPITLGTTESVGPNFQWDFLQKPDGSSDLLNNANNRQAGFRPYTPGDYVFQLTATNGIDVTYDSVVIHVVPAPCPTPTVAVPTISNNGDFSVNWNGTVSGATYFVEESFQGQAFSPVYSGFSPYLYLYGKPAGIYTYRVRSSAPGYADSAWGMSGSCTVTLTLAAPSTINVPSTSDTGNYKVSFGSSNATGITYILEESVNGGDFSQISSGGSSYAFLYSRAGGTYVYRVKAAKASVGFADSAWTTSSPCVVVGGAGNLIKLQAPPYISVPLTSATGNIRVSYGSSSVSDVTYTVEESVGGGPWNPIPVYTGPLSYKYLSNLLSAAYRYRVKASKSGYNDSDWTISSACNVTLALTNPSSISASVSPDFIKVRYGSSNVSGVTYHLEESKDSGPWQPVYSGAVAYKILYNRTTGSYRYRVMVTKDPGFAPSSYTTSGSYLLP